MTGPAFDTPAYERATTRRLLDWDREKLLESYRLLFGQGQAMWTVESFVLTAADSDAPVCIEGEPGTGKEMVAKTLHCLSRRSSGAWLTVRCSTLSEPALEHELFGDDASPVDGRRPWAGGVFECARRGTIFFDEIADLPPQIQLALLRVMQFSALADGIRRETDSTDPRVIAATSRNLAALVEAGTFCEDLYHRLNVLRVSIPPLRERRDEIPALVAHFTREFSQQFERNCPELSARTMDLLLRYPWPGNVRELKDLIEGYVRSGNERALRIELSARVEASSGPHLLSATRVGPLADGLRGIAMRAAREAEEVALRAALNEVGWNRAEAARRLKVSRKTLGKKLRALGLTPD